MAAASTATPEKKGKASGGRDDGKRAGERASRWLGMTRKRRISGLEKREAKARREGKVNRKKRGKRRGKRRKNKNGKREEHEKHRGNYFHNGAVYNVWSGTPARNKSARLGDMCSTRKTGNRGISKSWLTNDPIAGWLPG